MKKAIFFILILGNLVKSNAMHGLFDAVHRKDIILLEKLLVERKGLCPEDRAALLTEVKELIITAKSNMILRKSSSDIVRMIFGSVMLSGAGTILTFVDKRRKEITKQQEPPSGMPPSNKGNSSLEFTEKVGLGLVCSALVYIGCKFMYQGWNLEAAIKNLDTLRRMEDLIKRY